MYKIICVLVMILVTYIPRVFPLIFIKDKIENNFVKSFLFYVPYAVIASLTFPSILYFTDNMILAIIGTTVSLVLSILNQKMYVVAFISVVVVYGLSFFF